MNKIQEYRMMSKDVRQKRNALRTAKGNITSYQKECIVNDHEHDYISACLNKFEKVYGICSDLHAYDDGDFTKYCPLFGNGPCLDRKCPMYAKHLDYVVALERYDMAVEKRREFRRNLFHKKSK